MTVSTGKMSESPEPLWEPWRTEGGAEQKTGKVDSLVKLPAELPIISKQCNIVSLILTLTSRLALTLLFAVDLLPARPEPGVLAGSVLGAQDGEALVTAVDRSVTNIAPCIKYHWVHFIL